MSVKIGEILQVLIGLDQVTASVSRLVSQLQLTNEEDEATLRVQLSALRKRNDERFRDVEAMLEKKATGK